MIKRFLLATDFGGAGPYQGQLRTVLAELAPGVPVIDLLADFVTFRPDLAGYLLPHLLRDLPADNLVLAVVDPGVGGERDVLVLQTERNWFVAPDNGLLSQVARRAGRVRWWRVDWRPQRLSASFHGRDLFAPVAARIAVTV
jgi:hypothetical protein